MCRHQGKFQFLLRAKRVNPPILPVLDQYRCEASGQMYCGGCQITTCPANISADKHTSGCLYLFYDGRKKEFDKYDIMHAFDLKERAFKTMHDQGQAAATTAITLYNVLNMLRTRANNPQCTRCGIFLEDSSTHCKNLNLCSQREQIMLSVIASSNLKHPEYRGQPRDIYSFLRYKEDVETYLAEQKNIGVANLYHLFGLTPKTYETLAAISIYNRDPSP